MDRSLTLAARFRGTLQRQDRLRGGGGVKRQDLWGPLRAVRLRLGFAGSSVDRTLSLSGQESSAKMGLLRFLASRAAGRRGLDSQQRFLREIGGYDHLGARDRRSGDVLHRPSESSGLFRREQRWRRPDRKDRG